MYKIEIKDLNKLRFKRVKPWSIKFVYADETFLIHLCDCPEEDNTLELYAVEHNEVGNSKLELLNANITTKTPMDFIKDISNPFCHKKTITYSNIDKQYFVKKLVEIGWCKCAYNTEYQDYIEEVEWLKSEIKILENKIELARKNWEQTDGHGSKTNSLDRQFKIKACERIKGAKDKTVCKQAGYTQYRYGDIHPEYGGVLTDLFNLTYGTEFYCTNGNYNAVIGFDDHGDKCVITPNGAVKLTKLNHVAFIKQLDEE